ncbi:MULTISPECIES: glycosyltransferase [Burkholderia]|uniref:Glycosyltransferase involved in cell wall biosynthesis n=1 Tax=Burkholderia pyrrocinia TaxID=60550 RepID=A0A318IVJ1_BURPY|nr:MULTISPECIES: glycosyltransferase [Burkholderia]PXX39325.1 glycosyltransferase involved in cell wall biosynthesis [Burkholderia pyrrocinia]SFW19219.1 Glycosyltransferase involved in cell wall bisynthesis [Burkholderia sp. NFACC33-1]SFX15783.1 Glycosyltransferase involved in cell wall bisynthesis [Burkholderia sp. NFPP32]
MNLGNTRLDAEEGSDLPISPISLWWPQLTIASAWQVHAPFGFWLIDAVRPAVIVEWGMCDGFGYSVWCQAIRDLGLSAHCLAFSELRDGTSSATRAPSEQGDLHTPHVREYAPFSTLHDACARVADGTVGLLHIDLAHEDGDASRVLEAWRPKLAPDAIVLLHGTRRAGNGVRELWAALRSGYPSFEFEHGLGLGVVAVGKRYPARLRALFESGDRAEYIADLYAHLGDAVMQRSGSNERVEVLSAAASEGVQAGGADTIRELQATIDKQRTRLDLLARRLKSEARSAYLANEQLRQARAEVNALRGSTSWRITGPVRAAVGSMHGPRRVVSKVKNLSAIVGTSVRTRGVAATLRKIVSARKEHGLRVLLGAVPGLRSTPLFDLPPARPAQGNLALRVLLIAEMSIPQCLKYRVTQKQRMIEALGFDCSVVSWSDIENAKSLLQTHSIAIFYRVPGFPGPLELIAEAKALGLTTFWEVDDLIFDAEKYLHNSNLDKVDAETRKGVLAGVPLYRAAMLACDYGIASTSGLAQAMREAGVSKVYVIENALDEETIRVATAIANTPKKDDGLVRIAYGSGTKTHDADFREAAAAIKRVLAARPNVRLRILGELNLPDDFDDVMAQVERLPLSNYVTYLKRLAESDISIAPLEDNVFNDAKSNIKYLEAASIKLSSVCSPSAAFRTAIVDGDTGFLAADSAAWERALLSLIDNRMVRERMAERAFRHVHDDYAPEPIAQHQVLPVLAAYRAPQRKLRVLGVNIYFEPQRFGGATVVAEEMARRLNRSGALEYFMFSSLPTSDVPAYKLKRYDATAGGVFAMGLPGESDPSFGFENPHSLAPFREAVRAVRPDVVHLHSIQGIGAQIAEVCQDEDIPYVVTLHDAWWICGRQFMITGENRFCNQRRIDINVCATCVDNPNLNGYRQARLREVLDDAALLLVPSEYFRRLFIENGFSENKIVLNKNGIMAPMSGSYRSMQQKNVIRFGYVGGDTPIKGSHLIKSIFKRLSYTNYRLRVVDNVLNLGRRSIDPVDWKVTGELEIVPAYTQETIDAFFQEIDVLLCPTQCMESFGLSVREALVRNVWVIATDAGGLSEDIVPGENGDVIPIDDDGSQLEKAIVRLLERPARLDGYRNPYAHNIRLFDGQASELAQLLAGVASHSATPGRSAATDR